MRFQTFLNTKALLARARITLPNRDFFQSHDRTRPLASEEAGTGLLVRLSLLTLLLASAALAQTSSFPKPNYFRQVFEQTRTQVDLRDPVKLKDYLIDGKMELSLKNFLELVMANNTDIQVNFLSVEIPRNNITLTLGAFDPSATASFLGHAQHQRRHQPFPVGECDIRRQLQEPLSTSLADLRPVSGYRHKLCGRFRWGQELLQQ